MCENNYVRIRVYFTNLSAVHVHGARWNGLRQQTNEEKVATDVLMTLSMRK